MSNIMSLNEMFPKGKTYGTMKSAELKMKKFIAELPEDYRQHWHYVIIAKEVDDPVQLMMVTRYQPIAILSGANCRVPALWFIDRGICVTNV